MAQGRFNWFDVTLTVVSLVTLLVDVGTDLLVLVQFYLEGHTVWGSLMLTFTLIPLVVMNVFSIKWHSTDGSLTCPTILLHVFLLAPFQRYLRVLWLGFKSCLTGHPRYTDAALRGQNDAGILRLFETFLESAPQLVLQLYIMLRHPDHIDWIQVLSASSSLMSLAWALTAYCDTSRLNYRSTYQRRFMALCVHGIWQLFMATSRIAALVLFASVYQAWICLFAGLHWIVMTILIWVKGTDFGTGPVEKCLFRIVSGFMYIFVYLNVHDGPTRSRMTLYYCVMFLENAVLYAVWVVYADPSFHMKVAAAVLVFGGFLFGGVALTVYYRCLHPSGPNFLFTVKSTLPTTHPQRPQSPKERRPPPAAAAAADASCDLKGSTLELSIEGETPIKEQAKGGNSALSQLLDTSARGALESAWQSGMQSSSSSSSSSSLDADDCSLDAFNTTANQPDGFTSHSSAYSALLGKSQSRKKNTSQSQQSAASQPQPSDCAAEPQPAVKPKDSRRSSSSSSRLASDSIPRLPGNNSETASVRERVSESDGQQPLDGVVREEADGTEAAPSTRSRSRLGGRRSANTNTTVSPAFFGTSQLDESSPRTAREDTVGASAMRTELVAPARHQDAEPRTAASHQPLSPLDASRLWSAAECQHGSAASSDDIFPPSARRRSDRLDRLSRSFDLGDTPVVLSPDSAGGQVCTSRGASFRRSEREAMAPYPDLVESLSPDQRQQARLFEEDGYGERAGGGGDGGGGESMWSPDISTNNTSNSSSSRGHAHPAGLPPPSSSATPGSAPFSPQPALVDSFDSESEPICINSPTFQQLLLLGAKNAPPFVPGQVENRRLGQLRRESASASPSNSGSLDFSKSPNTSSSGSSSPAANVDTAETSWSSMNVNEDELSGLNNLTNLTPDDSLCSFASSDREAEAPGKPSSLSLEEMQRAQRTVSALAAEMGAASGASTPNLPRSRSTSSLYHEFSSAGVSPSPPPGLRAARLTRNSSWANSPDAYQLWQQQQQESSGLDYLNVDPAPPVDCEGFAARPDPREVVIELLMDQLKRANVRPTHSRPESSRLSPLAPPRGLLREPALHHGRSQFAPQASRSHFSEDLDATLLSNPEPAHHRGRSQFAPQASVSRFGEDLDATLLSNPEPRRSRAAYRTRSDLDLMREALDLIEMQRYSFHSRSSDSESPDRYVSGQYRPPIISQDREQQQARGPRRDGPPPHPAEREQERLKMRSKRIAAIRQARTQSTSLPRQNSSYQRDLISPSPLSPLSPGMDARRSSLPCGERDGLYRYFVDSYSPIHTPQWNNTPAATTPSQRHLLHRYLADNHVEQPGSQPATRAVPRSPRKPTTALDLEHLTSSLFLDQASAGARKAVVSLLSEKLEVVTDNPDSGVHSASLSATSRRQPLQSLNNSPSLSPSSVTQQPVQSKPQQPAAFNKSSAGSHAARSGFVASGGTSQAGSLPSPKRGSSRPRPHPAHRPGTARNADRRSGSEYPAPLGSLSSRAKSSDCLR